MISRDVPTSPHSTLLFARDPGATGDAFSARRASYQKVQQRSTRPVALREYRQVGPETRRRLEREQRRSG
jgi:hypothetical protein